MNAYERSSTSSRRSAIAVASSAHSGFVGRFQEQLASNAFERLALSAGASSSALSIHPLTSASSGRFGHMPERRAVWNASSAYELAHTSRSWQTASDRSI